MSASHNKGLGISPRNWTAEPVQTVSIILFFRMSCRTYLTLEPQNSSRDASSRLVLIEETPSFSVQVGSQFAIVEHSVFEGLRTKLLLSCDFCEAHVDAMRPRNREKRLAGGTSVPFLQGPRKRSKDLVSLRKEQKYTALKRRSSHMVIAGKTIFLQPSSHTWMTVSAPKAGLLQKELHRRSGDRR